MALISRNMLPVLLLPAVVAGSAACLAAVALRYRSAPLVLLSAAALLLDSHALPAALAALKMEHYCCAEPQQADDDRHKQQPLDVPFA